MDLLLGHFADRYLATMSDDEIAEFEALLTCPDQKLYDWYCGKEPVPQSHLSPLMTRFLAFDVSPFLQGTSPNTDSA